MSNPLSNLFTYVIDVSNHQGIINWGVVKRSTNPLIKGAYIKATEGIGYIDPMVTRNANGASGQKIPFGFYHYAHTTNNPVDEANNFVKVIKTLPPYTYVPMLDIEENKALLSPDALHTWIVSFVNAMKAKGLPCGLYSFGAFLRTNLPVNHTLGKLPLWFANVTQNLLPTLPHGFTNFHLWQFTFQAKVPGISVPVDMSKTNSDLLKNIETGSALTIVLLLIVAGILILQ